MNLFKSLCITIILIHMFALNTAQAQIQIVRKFEISDLSDSFFLGSANMDNDLHEELVYAERSSQRIIILDGFSGEVEWDSKNILTSIWIAGWLHYDKNYGFSPFCDIDNDGIKEITFIGSDGTQPHYKVFVVGLSGSTSVPPIQQINEPKQTFLQQNYPNPFNPSTTISYEITDPAKVNISIFDELGRLVRTLVDKKMEAGQYSTVWDGKNDSGISVSSGMYFYRLKVGDQIMSKKAILVK